MELLYSFREVLVGNLYKVLECYFPLSVSKTVSVVCSRKVGNSKGRETLDTEVYLEGRRTFTTCDVVLVGVLMRWSVSEGF